MIDITKLVIAIIGICVALVTKFVIPWVRSKINTENQIIAELNQAIIESVAKVVVCAAQQLFTHAEHKEKKDYAMERVKTMLAQYNIELSTEELNTYVEGALKKIKMELGDTAVW